MKINSTTNTNVSKNSNADFYIASQIYSLDKASKAAKVPRLRSNDYRNVPVKKKGRVTIPVFEKEHFKFEFTAIKRGFQKVLALAHIH